MSEYFPVMLDVRGRTAVVLGDSKLAQDKADALQDAGAQVRLVPGWPQASDLVGAFLIVAVTNDSSLVDFLRTSVSSHQLLNVMDRPDACNFVFTSVMRRGPLTVSVSTEGTAPALARLVRHRIESLFGPEWEDFMRLAAQAREDLRASGASCRHRVDFFEALMASDVLSNLHLGDVDAARGRIGDLLHASR